MTRRPHERIGVWPISSRTESGWVTFPKEDFQKNVACSKPREVYLHRDIRFLPDSSYSKRGRCPALTLAGFPQTHLGTLKGTQASRILGLSRSSFLAKRRGRPRSCPVCRLVSDAGSLPGMIKEAGDRNPDCRVPLGIHRSLTVPFPIPRHILPCGTNLHHLTKEVSWNITALIHCKIVC